MNIGVGLIGFGLAGQLFHAPFITQVAGLELKKIRSTNPDAVRQANALYPDALVVSDSAEIFSDDSIQLVVIAVPNELHYNLAKEALLAGKHVVVDKPFTVTTSEADELIALAQKQQKVLTVYQNRRFDSDFRTIQQVLGKALLGRVVDFEAHFDRFRNFIKLDTWKEQPVPGSGILYDLGSHLIDQALCLFGLPQEVYGDVRIQRDGSAIPDQFTVVLHYQSLKATLKAGMLVRYDGPRYKIFGDKGSFVKHGLDVQEEALKVGKLPANTTNWGKEPEAIWGRLQTTINGQEIDKKIKSELGNYAAFYENVYQAILGKAELEVKPEQARSCIKVIELAIQSSQEKRTLPFR